MANQLPVYIQIHNKIREEIKAGKWAVGSRIPSERELALTFQVSRMTLRQAIQTLVDEGILERKVGSGTFVSNQKVQEKMSGISGFTDMMTSQGKTPASKTITYHVTTPSASEMEKLALNDGEMVIRMERIRYADNVPICFEVATIPHRFLVGFSKKEITESLYHTLAIKAGLKAGKAEQTISAMLVSERIAEFLAIKRGSAVLRLRQITYLTNGTPFEYVRTQYVGDRFEFYLEK